MANRDFSRPLAGVDAELAFPGDVGTGARGMPAKRVQEWLVFDGYTLAVDGDFGGATERAVRGFQNTHATLGLSSTGVVDELTWAALTAPLHRAMRPIDGTGKTFNELVCLYARQHLVEKPVEIGGPNDGPWVRAYMLGNGGRIWQWCAGFSSMILSLACTAAGVPMPIKPSFGVPELARSAKARGRFSADGPPVPGDVFVIPTATGSWSHTGIVLEVRGDRFLSAEGNTSAEGSSDGVCARSVLRNPARCDFIRVAP